VARRIGSLSVLAALAIVSVAVAETCGPGIRGVVLNKTCPGPCAEPPPPWPPYEGEDLTVRVRSLPEGRLVASLRPTDGSFGVDLPPGNYRVRAFVGRRGDGVCWKGDVKRVVVTDAASPEIELNVQNVCVL